MPLQSWVSLLNAPAASVAGSTLTNSTVITDVSPAPQLIIPPGFFTLGSAIRVTAFGTISTAASSQGTLKVGVYYGGVAGVSLADTGTPTPTASASSWPWRLEYTGTVRVGGSAGQFFGAGYFDIPTSLTAWTHIPIPAATMALSTARDMTAAQALTIGAQWGTASASNIFILNGAYFESLT